MNAEAFHKSLTVIDGHCDTILDLMGQGCSDPPTGPRDFFSSDGRGMVDLPRLEEGGVACQVMALFTDAPYLDDAAAYTMRCLDFADRLFETQPARFSHATKTADIRAAKAAGRVSGLISIEGGEALGRAPGEDSGPEAEALIGNLRAFYRRGIRLITLTWSRPNPLGMGVSPSSQPQKAGGLTPLGRRVVHEMEKLGMVVDVSHLSDQGLDDVLKTAERPIVASHSNSRALCSTRRNLRDDQAEAIAETGGLIGLTFCGPFIDPDPAKVSRERWFAHLEHLISVAGIDHVGLGSDFDGYQLKSGRSINSCAELPWISSRMLEAGYSEADTAKVMGGNWLRVFSETIG